MHIKESNCIIKKEVEKGNILETRYLNYKKFVGEESENIGILSK